jgi:hypothetical protein
MVHDYTPITNDAPAWMEAKFPEGDVRIKHSSRCDALAKGDECIGGCEVVDLDMKMYVVCRQCGEAFDDLTIAHGHAGTCGSDQGFDVCDENEAF